MSRDRQRLADYLAHIIEAIGRIESYTAGMAEPEFLNNHMVQDAVIRNFEVIGEASNNINKHYPDFVREHPEMPLAFAYQMRNAVAHGYFTVDFKIVWTTIQNNLPRLHSQIEQVQTGSKGAS